MNREIVVFGCSLIIGSLIWAFSSLITGHAEPWDAEGTRALYYPITLFMAGVICSVFSASDFIYISIGVFLGQILYLLLFMPSGPLFLFGVIICALYTILTFLGAFLVYKISCLLSKLS